MFNLSNIYHPLTAKPFMNNETYIEVQPCEDLKPYICCFWGMPKPYSSITTTEMGYKLVIPDTCMDIIFSINSNKNQLNDLFVGISDTTFKDNNASPTIACFGIRFYSWAVPLFSDESMKYTLNTFAQGEAYFKNFKCDLQEILISNSLIFDRVEKLEKYLIKRLDLNKQNNNVMNSIYKILKSKGTASISELASYTAVSHRQLERLFLEYVGVSPKKLSQLVRYQYLWQDILLDINFNIHDSVCKYGYTDQSYLINDFKRYHTLSPINARKFAYETR